MVEIDPGLDTRLRAFFDHYEAEAMPSRLATFDQGARTKGRTAVQFVAGAVGVAVIAAAAVVFAIELNSHNHTGKSPAGPSPVSWSKLPILGASPPLPANYQTLVPLTLGKGSATLPSFTPRQPYYIEIACMGSGPLNISTAGGSLTGTQYGCGSPGTTEVVYPDTNQVLGRPVLLKVDAPDMTWEMLVVESSAPVHKTTVSVPFEIPSGATVLLPQTGGTGTAVLPTFTPDRPPYYIEEACDGPGAISIVFTSGAPFGGAGPCSGLTDATGVIGSDPNSPTVAPQSLEIKADPSTSWEILIYEVSGDPRP